MTAIIFGVATISNNNLQDLKTGQLVEATPWRQQVALVLGVVFGALVIPPILDLMNTAFTFQGAPGAKATALAAPQAAIISTIAQGVLGGNLDWGLIGQGAIIGVVAVIVDEAAEAQLEQAAAPAAAGDRHGHLSAAGSGLADPVRRGARLVLQSLGDEREQPRLRRAHGRADGDRPDRRRKPDGRGLRRSPSPAPRRPGRPTAPMCSRWSQPYSAVMLVSLVVFAAAIAGLYFWTKGRASDAPAPGDDAIAPEATYR